MLQVGRQRERGGLPDASRERIGQQVAARGVFGQRAVRELPRARRGKRGALARGIEIEQQVRAEAQKRDQALVEIRAVRPRRPVVQVRLELVVQKRLASGAAIW